MPRRGLSITFWRYALIELWRLILLTTFVLVTVIAFAATVKPLADGKIGPLDALRFMALAAVPMMQYALPFAAGFAATLAYHRLAQDNEVAAAYASGVSHRAILAPAVLSGLVLAIVLAVLNQVTIPRFLRSMQELITQDLSKIIVASIERGQPVPIENNTQLYADHVIRMDPKTDPRLTAAGAKQWLVLEGVAAIETKNDGLVKIETIAPRAQLVVFPPAGRTEDAMAVLQLERGVFVEKDKGVGRVEESRPVPIPIKNAFKDDPKFLSFTELSQLRRHPEAMNWIEHKRRETAFTVAERLTTERIRADFAARREVVFSTSDGQRAVLRATGMHLSARGRWDIEPLLPENVIEVELSRPPIDGKPAGAMILTAPAASLFTTIDQAGTERDLAARLVLQSATTRILASDGKTQTTSGGVLSEKVLTGLRLTDAPADELLDGAKWPSSRLLDELVAPRVNTADPDLFIKPAADDLRRSIDRLMAEITSKQHERWAMSAACFVMIVTGALTAIRLADSLPLTVYLWSFFPALATVITISSGQQLTHNEGPAGLLVLWGGVLAFGAYAVAVYWKLRRR